MSKLFQASQFTPTQFNTAEDKAKFANALIRFIESGYKPSLFTKKLYNRLSGCFGFIAENDIHGFYSEWFEDQNSQRRFLEQILNWPCYGDAAFTYSDVEKALQPHIKTILYPLFP